MDLSNVDVAVALVSRKAQLENEWLGHELNRKTAEADTALSAEERDARIKAATDAQATIDAAYEVTVAMEQATEGQAA